MSTVPLPVPAHPTHAAGPLWSEQQMLAYGEACSAEAREEIERLRKAIADKGGTEHSPTQFAYDKVCEVLNATKKERDELRAENEVLRNKSSLAQYKELDGDEITDPLEKLRFFCSLAMSMQDWLDVEEFFIGVEAAMAKE